MYQKQLEFNKIQLNSPINLLPCCVKIVYPQLINSSDRADYFQNPDVCNQQTGSLYGFLHSP